MNHDGGQRSMAEWYFAMNNARQGPLPQANLMQMLASGEVPADAQVWTDGMPNWASANSLPDLGVGSVQPVLGYGLGDTLYQPAQLRFNYAGFWIRLGAALIDGVIVFVINYSIGFGFGLLTGSALGNSQMAQGVAALSSWAIGVVIAWLYFALQQSSPAQASIGQRACGLKTVDDHGHRLSFARASGRYFASLLSGIILYIGYFMMLWTEKNQTLHDIIADTLVIFD